MKVRFRREKVKSMQDEQTPTTEETPVETPVEETPAEQAVEPVQEEPVAEAPVQEEAPTVVEDRSAFNCADCGGEGMTFPETAPEGVICQTCHGTGKVG